MMITKSVNLRYYFSFVFIFFASVCAETDWEVATVAVVYALRPTVLLATVCWPTQSKLRLYSTLTTGQLPISVQFSEPAQDVTQRVEDHHVLFLIDMGCDKIDEHFELHNRKHHFRSPFRWLLIGNDNNRSNSIIPNAIDNITLLPDSEVIVGRYTDNNSIEFYYIYRISSNRPWRKESYGTWNKQKGFQKIIKQTEITAARRLNLERHEITVCFVVLNNNSIDHMTDGIDQHIDTVSKVVYRTIHHLVDFMNAESKLVYENTWGYKVNGTWTGLTGRLVRNEAEIGGTPMFIIKERVPLVDYISRPTPTNMKFVFQQPKLSYTSNLFLLSFKTSVWYCALGLTFLMFLALLAVSNWEWRKNKYVFEVNHNERILRGNIQDVVLLIFGAACQQGSPVELKGSLGRIVMFILFLTLTFLYTSYSANIVALLQSSSSQIKTLDDLLHSRLKLAVHDTVYSRHYFSIATDPVRKAIYQTKIAPPGVKPRFISMEEGVKNMQKGLFAFNMELGVGYRLVNKYFREGEKCSLSEIPFVNLLDPWQAIRKNSPYKEMFKIGLKRITEHGLQERENLLLYVKRPKCSGRESHFISVSMVDCYPALLVLAYGMIIALFFLVIELLLKKRETLVDRICCVEQPKNEE